LIAIFVLLSPAAQIDALAAAAEFVYAFCSYFRGTIFIAKDTK